MFAFTEQSTYVWPQPGSYRTQVTEVLALGREDAERSLKRLQLVK